MRRRFVVAAVAMLVASPVPAADANPTGATGPVPPRRAAEAESVPSVDVSALPSFESLARGKSVAPLLGGVSLSDSFLIRSWGFDDLSGECRDRGWRTEDLTTKTFTSITTQYVRNQPFAMPSGSGLRVHPARTSLAALPAPALGINIGPVASVTRDAQGRLAAFVVQGGDGELPRPALVRLAGGQWEVVSTQLPGSARATVTAYDPAGGRFLLFDDAGGRLWAIAESDGSVSHVAGDPAGSPLDTLGVHHAFGEVRGMACDAAGRVYLSTEGRIRMLRTDGRIVTLAGNGTDGSSGDGGPPLLAELSPGSLAVDDAGHRVLFGQRFGWAGLRVLDLAAGRIDSLAGTANSPGGFAPWWVAWSSTSFYAASGALYRVVGSTLEHVAGGNGGLFSSTGDILDPRALEFYVAGLASNAQGGVYVLGPSAVTGGSIYSRATATTPLLEYRTDATVSQVAGIFTGIRMGTRAFTFGAESVGSEDVLPEGLNQFLVSPVVPTSTPHGVEIRLEGIGPFIQSLDSNDYLTIDYQVPDGSWRKLQSNGNTQGSYQPSLYNGMIEQGPGWFSLRGRIDPELVGAPTTRFRVRGKSSEVAYQSPRLFVSPGLGVVDNIQVQDTLGNPILPTLDFEDGALGAWTLGAVNGRFTMWSSQSYTYMSLLPAGPANQAGLSQDFDYANRSCVWTFTAGGDSIPIGAHAAIVSPWTPAARPDSAFYAILSGRLNSNYFFSKMTLTVHGQAKAAGGTTLWSGAVEAFDGLGGGSDDFQRYVNGVGFRFDPPDTIAADSVRVVIVLADASDRSEGPGFGGRRPSTRLPYLDDIQIVQFAADSDFDGVADRTDACATESGAGQDADGDGCPDPTATLRHVESWPAAARPIRYRIAGGDPRILDGSSATAVREAFASWADVEGAEVEVEEVLGPAGGNAAALDGVNTVTFTDPDFRFPPNVVAVTPTTSFTLRGAFNDEMVLPGQIVDADILFNPDVRFGTATWDGGAGSYDLKSVAIHEAGHFLGLGHSGTFDATMFYVIQPDTLATSLATDDRAAMAAAYPDASFQASFGAIAGTVVRGQTGEPVPGALITAVRLEDDAPVDSSATDYSDERGRWALRGLAPGDYAVRLTPLDGEVGGYPLTPEDISLRVASIAQTNFQAEWWSPDDSDRDDPGTMGRVTVAAGPPVTGIQIVTNVDTIPPTVRLAAPDSAGTGVRVDARVVLEFSERIDPTSFAPAFRIRTEDDTTRIRGTAHSFANERSLVFEADPPFDFETTYVVELATELRDREGVALAAPYAARFTTMARPPLALRDIQPRKAPAGAFVTLVGDGFDPGSPAANAVRFTPCPTCPPQVVQPASVTPSAVVVAVPTGAATGDVTVTLGAETSNAIELTVLPPSEVAAPSPLGADIALSFAPTDVALAPDGSAAFAVGDQGLARIELITGRPGFRTEDLHPTVRGRALAMSPAGDLLYVSRPDQGDVVAVGTDPTGFRVAIATMPLGDGVRPEGLAISAAGTRLFVSEGSADRVHEIDVDAISSSRFRVVRERRDTTAVLGGALAVTPRGDRLVYPTTNLGLRVYDFLLGSPFELGGRVADGGVAVTPAEVEALFAGGEASPGVLAFARISGPPGRGSIELGGTVRDVAVTPDGRSAVTVNSTFGRLQVVGLDPDDPATYHQRVSEAPTGPGPVAVAISGDGALTAVANGHGRSVSLFGVGATAGLVRVTPRVAVAGARVAVQGSGPLFDAGARIDLGGALAVPTFVGGGGAGAGFAVPSTPQGDVALTVESGDGTRTRALPFRVLDPVAGFAPAGTGVSLALPPNPCGPGTVGRALASADGRWLAVAHDHGGACAATVALADVRGLGAEALPAAAVVADLGSPARVTDLAFRADGQELWAVQEGRAEIVIVGTGEGASLGSVTTFALPGVQPVALASDPLGRWMVVADGLQNALHVVDPATRAVAGTLPLSGAAGPLAVTGDGGRLVAAEGHHAVVVDLGALTLLGATPGHGDPGTSRPLRLVMASDARRVAAFYPGGTQYAVWNLDASAGGLGAEVHFGAAVPGSAATLEDAVPAPDAAGLVAVSDGLPDVLRIDLAQDPPVVTAAPGGGPSTAIARSDDGRRLWTGRADGAVEQLALTDATAITLVAGNGQSAAPGEPLPIPVRVRVTDALGAAAGGVMVRFTLADASHGSLDGAGERVERLTDARGDCEVVWTMPSAAGRVALAATLPGLTTPPVAATATAEGDPALVAPVVLELGPADGATGVHSRSPVFAYFNQSMDPTGEYGLSLFVDGAQVAGTLRIEEQGRLWLFEPLVPLAYESRCSLAVSAGIRDAEGQSLAAGASAVFFVEPAPSLRITSVHPPAGPPGGSVVITGTGFSPVPSLNVVRFAGFPAVVTAAGDRELSVRVPLEAPPVAVVLNVQVAGATSNDTSFVVWAQDAEPGQRLLDAFVARGIGSPVLSADGRRLFLLDRSQGRAIEFSVDDLEPVRSIPVGVNPIRIALAPDATRLYVCNEGGLDLAVVDVDPESDTAFEVVERVPLGGTPVDLALSAWLGELFVPLAEGGWMRVIDVQRGNATYHRVTATVNAGSRGKALVIAPDGGQGYLLGADGRIQVIDLRGRAVTASVNTGSKGKALVISPDGGLLFVLVDEGVVKVIDVSRIGAVDDPVTATVNTGSKGKALVISPDGGQLWILDDASQLVTVWAIGGAAGDPASVAPGPPVTLTLLESFPVGEDAGGIAINPLRGSYVVVSSAATGALTFIGDADALPIVPATFDLSPNRINLRSMGKWVTGRIELPPPLTAADIDVPSLRLNGVLAPDPEGPAVVEDDDGDGVPELKVKFSRPLLSLLLPDGEHVPVTVRGSTPTREFQGTDWLRVRRAQVLAPGQGEVVPPGSSYQVRWEVPHQVKAPTVALLLSYDGGANWTTIARDLENKGCADWTVPLVAEDSARIAVVLIECVKDSAADEVEGVLAVSGPFRIRGVTEVSPAPATLAFSPAWPNPARGEVRFRFGIPPASDVELDLFDVQGRRVVSLARGRHAPGWHELRWDGRSADGRPAGPGLFFARFRSSGKEFTERFVWLR